MAGLTGLSVGLAGCSALSELAKMADEGASETKTNDNDGRESTDTPNEGSLTNEPLPTSEGDLSKSFASFEQEETLEAGHWYTWNLDLTGMEQPIVLTYTMTVRHGEAIDVFVLEKEEEKYYDEGQRTQYLDSYSRLDTIFAEVSESISEGEYVLILDNSSRGEAPGESEAEVTIDVDIE